MFNLPLLTLARPNRGAIGCSRHRPPVELIKMTHNCRTAILPCRGKVSSLSDIPGTGGRSGRDAGGYQVTRLRFIPFMVIAALALSLSACTNPYDPVQRMIGGGLIGAGSGAAIGAAAAGGHGAALGAAIGGAVGAVGGLITTPPPPAHYAYYNHRHYSYYNHQHYASYNRRKTHCADCGQAVGSTATAQANASSRY